MLKWILLAVALLVAVAAWSFIRRVSSAQIYLAKEPGGSVHRFALQAANGDETPCSAWAGQVVLLVNTASKCGYTGQYDDLEKLYQRFKDRGFTVIGVPSNDFLGQEPGSNADIQAFCRLSYGVTFPVLAKQPVKGVAAHPLFRWIQDASPVPGTIPWNFTKYLIGRDGSVLARFDPKVAPDDPRVIAEIDKALAGH